MDDQTRKIMALREKLAGGGVALGSWMQLDNPSVAEIMGHAGYDWVAVDLEHGHFSLSGLPDLFRALELGGTLPFARIARGRPKEIKLYPHRLLSACRDPGGRVLPGQPVWKTV
jgi:2-dehydro-3-deoxyglucarate aldolase